MSQVSLVLNFHKLARVALKVIVGALESDARTRDIPVEFERLSSERRLYGQWRRQIRFAKEIAERRSRGERNPLDHSPFARQEAVRPLEPFRLAAGDSFNRPAANLSISRNVAQGGPGCARNRGQGLPPAGQHSARRLLQHRA
jgi:hypothetical protein